MVVGVNLSCVAARKALKGVKGAFCGGDRGLGGRKVDRGVRYVACMLEAVISHVVG